MLNWLMLAGAVALAAASKPQPKSVTLKAGRTYRLRLEVVASTVPLSPQLLDGIRQGLELAGMTDVVVRPGAKPAVEYTQRTLIDTELRIGERIPFALGGIELTIMFVWAKEIAGPPGA